MSSSAGNFFLQAPLATLFHGDVTIEEGCDLSNYGQGNLSVDNNVYIWGTSNSVNSSSGALLVQGGVGVGGDTNLNGTLTVSSTSNLQTTYVDTTNGPFSVSGGNAVTVQVGSNVYLSSTGGNTTVNSNVGIISITSGDNVSNAIQITNTNAGGGTVIQSGQNSGVVVGGGSGGINANTSAGNINITANNGSASFVVNSSTANQNLTISQAGGTDSSILITSDGTNVTNPAIQISSTNVAGNIVINNATAGTGSITNLSGSGGYFVTTNTGGPIGLTANGANSYFLVNATGGSGQSLTVGVTGGSYANNQLILESNGTSTSGALIVQTTNTSGSILIQNSASGSGNVTIDTGSGGLTAVTQPGGGINLTAYDASSSFINQTNNSGQDLTICVQGTTGSSLILCSQGTGPNALQINSYGNTGGITMTAQGVISICASGGINLGTCFPGAPVTLGTNTSIVTVPGDLTVLGTTTTYQSNITQINDPFIELNNGPSNTSDSGIALKQYQPANNNCIGDVASGPSSDCGTIGSAAITSTTVTILSTNSSSSYTTFGGYNGWWIKITNVSPAYCEIRRVKSYNDTTNLITIYSTADQTGVLANTVPPEGLDFDGTDMFANAGALPVSGYSYCLYCCSWIIAMWDATSNEFALVCSSFVTPTSLPPICNYIDLHVNNIIANNVECNTINGTPADYQVSFTLTDNSTTPVTIPLTTDCGLYIVMIRPNTATATRCAGIFVMGRLCSVSSCGQVSRLIGVRGSNNELIDCDWPANANPRCFYRPAPGGGGTTTFVAKVITI
jgi:hypothetical protein